MTPDRDRMSPQPAQPVDRPADMDAAGAATAPPPKSNSRRLGRRSVSFIRAQWRPILLIGFIVAVLVIFREVLTPFILAFALAYVLFPAVQALARVRVGRTHLPVWASILIVYIVLLGGVAMLVSLAAPPVLAQFQKLIDNVPMYADQADAASTKVISRLEQVLASWERRADESAEEDQEEGDEEALAGEVQTNAVVAAPVEVPADPQSQIAPRSSTVSQAAREVMRENREKVFEWLKQMSARMPAFMEGLARSIFGFFLVLMLTFMYLVYFPTLFAFIRRLVPVDYRPEFENIAREVNQRLAGVVRGQLLICLLNGVLTYIGFSLIGVKFASLLAFVAGVLSLIPIFGTIISTIPAALIGFSESLAMGGYVIGWVIIIHIFEAYVFNPKIMGDSAHMNPLFIVFAILVGSHYFHPVLGPLLAAPIAAIIQTVFLHFLTRANAAEPEPVRPPTAEAPAPSVPARIEPAKVTA